MENNYFIHQETDFNNSHSINPFDSTFNPNRENLINRKAAALDLPTTPVVEDYYSKIKTNEEEEDPFKQLQDLINSEDKSGRVESVPFSELRYQPIQDSFNPLEIIFLVLIFLATFRVLTSKSLFSNTKNKKTNFLNQNSSSKKTEKHLEKINKFRELLRKRDDGEISSEDFEMQKKELFNL